MRHDIHKLDAELMMLRNRRRAALSALHDGGDSDGSPLFSRLFRLHEELRESDDTVAHAIADWLDVMVIEGAVWDDRAKLEGLWHEVHRVPQIDDPLSLHELKRKVLREPSSGLRERFGNGLIAKCGAASDCALVTLEWRLEKEQSKYLAVDGQDVAVSLAERLLRETGDVVEGAARGLLHCARAAVCTEAAEGWPARLTRRWLADVFGGAELGAGLDVRLDAMPTPWGAMSFSRALGQLGTSVLDATRPQNMPFSLHKRPRGHRRHARRALFASVVLERPFGKTVLGLGSDRLRDHRRHVAIAMALSLRFDALRVLVTSALCEGRGAARDQFGDLTSRHFGEAAQASLLGVVPFLRPADGAALAGAVVAFGQRAALIDEYDEDWFRNPRAIESIRNEDEAVAGPLPDAEALEAAMDSLKDLLESAVG